MSAGLAQAAPLDELLEDFRADSQAAQARDQERLERLLEDQSALQAAVADAEARLSAARERREGLEAQQQEQRQSLEALSARRAEQAGDLEGVFDVARRYAGELRDDLGESWLTVGTPTTLPKRLDEQGLLDVATLASLRDNLAALVAETAREVHFTAPVAGSDGEIAEREVIRLGDFLAFSNGDLLRLSGEEERLVVAEHTPAQAEQALRDFQQGTGDVVTFDPTKGAVLDALAQQPSLWERFNQGGAVGYVVVALGVLGLLVALAQYLYLLVVSRRMHQQLRQPETLRDNNPLGRVLQRFSALGREHAPEALEARLDEALLAEQPRLERGQPLVKLLAAIAPLLGLLGTVTGMIVTFQSITVFGTGDPKLMAGGISQALVTTVLGLITAVPLLFAHTALLSRSRALVGLLEGRASAVLAEHLESQTVTTETRGHAVHS
ncbi:MotA/TolQ/ExbB proton channel family protein [Halomonas sp. WWR20]